MTGIEMCEEISTYWKETRGIDVEPVKIWESSPTGELSQVFMWYEEAQAYFSAKEALNGPMTNENRTQFIQHMRDWLDAKRKRDMEEFYKRHHTVQIGNAEVWVPNEQDLKDAINRI